jgi:hypothetical protein
MSEAGWLKQAIADVRKDFTDRKRVTKIPDIGEKGWVGNG